MTHLLNAPAMRLPTDLVDVIDALAILVLWARRLSLDVLDSIEALRMRFPAVFTFSIRG